MELPENPIFVFLDNLMIFRSIDEAAGYPEYEENITTYDKHGTVVQVDTSGNRTTLPENKRDELIRELRHHLIRLAANRRNKLDRNTVAQASDEELIRLALQWHATSGPSLRAKVALTLFVPFVFVIVMAFVLLVLVPMICWNAVRNFNFWVRWKCLAFRSPAAVIIICQMKLEIRLSSKLTARMLRHKWLAL
jgi:hypothetical protein